MRILHLLHEFPFPPTSGIRCDMGRRLSAFAALGHEVLAVCWFSGEKPLNEHLTVFDGLVKDRVLLQIGNSYKSKLRRLWHLRRHPSYVAARIPSKAEFEKLLERIAAFNPDLIWLEGVHPAWMALELRRALKIPLVYRAHNIEHRYVAEQARLAQSVRLKFALIAGTWGLEDLERELQSTAESVQDISVEDLAWWASQGFVNGNWLAPQAERAILDTAHVAAADRTVDLLFLGSLSSPNNIAGLRWYIEKIHPLIKKQIPDIKVTIAGRNPAKELASLLRQNNILLVSDPKHAAPLYASARVMMNPILHGSGVNIKTVDMLASGQPVVTTEKGGRGLPLDVVRSLEIVHGTSEFAETVVRSVAIARTKSVNIDRRSMINEIFGLRAVADSLAQFERDNLAI